MCPTIISSRAPRLGSGRRFVWVLAALLLWCGVGESRTRHKARHFRAQATAYCRTGTTADGGVTRKGIVAADPAVLPLGTKIRVEGAGVSGTYVVTDTGRKIGGRRIDIFMPSRWRAKRFGRKIVEVHVVSWGEASPS
jgi:3D (Asp-Asp-Asp) domain-containing protein